MKKLLIGLLALGSISAFASSTMIYATPLNQMSTMCNSGEGCQIWYNLKTITKKKSDTQHFHIIFKNLDQDAQMLLRSLDNAAVRGKGVQIDLNVIKRFDKDQNTSEPVYQNEIDSINVY